MKNGGEWREVELSEHFTLHNGKRLTKSQLISGDIPYISSSSFNNGIQEYIGNNDGVRYENCLSIAYNGKEDAIFYHPYTAIFSDNVRVIKFKEKSAGRYQYLYMISTFKRVRERFNYGNPMSTDKLKLEKITAPFQNNRLAFSYMENYIKALEAERIETLEAYLTVTGLNDYHLTKKDEQILDTFTKLSDTKSRVEYLGISWKEYKISSVFNLQSSKRKFNANSVNFGGKFPYVARGEKDNGVRGYITEDEEYLNAAKTISFGQDTATMFYQEIPYFTGDKIKILSTKEIELDKHLAFYLITSMKKSFSNFSWGSSSFNEEILKNTQITLPKNGEIDYDFMSAVIVAVQKLVIKDLVEWTDKKLEATREVVSR